MKKIVVFLIATLFASLSLHAQKASEDIIYLKNGEKYTGEIVLKNAEIVLLKTADGKRFQFQIAEIEKITQQEKKTETPKTPVAGSAGGSIAGIVQVNGGIASVKGGFGASPTADVSLAFGARNVLKTNAFLGAGAGYETIFLNQRNTNLAFLPVFVLMQYAFGEKIIRPAVNVKTGYAFHLQNAYKGGFFFQLSGGADYHITPKSSLYFGLFGRLQRTYGAVTETLPQGDFSANSGTVIRTFGLATAFIF